MHCLDAGREGCVTLVSGGDDQAVHVAVFQCSPSDETVAAMLSPEIQLTMLSSCHVVSAHTSAIRVRHCLIPTWRHPVEA